MDFHHTWHCVLCLMTTPPLNIQAGVLLCLIPTLVLSVYIFRHATTSILCLQGLCSLALSNAINGIRGIEPLSSKYRGIDTYCASYTNATGVLKNEKTNSCVYRLFPALFPATPSETDRAFFIFWNFLNSSSLVLIYNRDLL